MIGRSLKLVARVTGGSTPSPRASNWEGDTPFVTPPDLNGLDGAEITVTARAVTESALSQTRMVPRGVLVSCRAPIGHVGTASGSVTFNQGCKSIEPEIGDLRFLAYVLVAKRSEMQALGRGTTFLEISGQQLGDLKVPWPSLPTQHRIADYLDRETAQIDAMAEALDGLVARLEERRVAAIENATHALSESSDGIPHGWVFIPFKWAVEAHFPGDWGGDPGTNDTDRLCVRVADFDRTSGTVGGEVSGPVAR